MIRFVRFGKGKFLAERNQESVKQVKKLNKKLTAVLNDNTLMKDIVEKLQALVFGANKHHISETRNSVIIEDSESLNEMIKNAKRSCSWK